MVRKLKYYYLGEKKITNKDRKKVIENCEKIINK